MSTLSMTHEAISAALAENLPLTPDQRAALLTLVAADKRGQELWDASTRWQPIETAPTGRRALLWAPGRTAPVVDDWGKYCAYNHPKFTHWMPLPALPPA